MADSEIADAPSAAPLVGTEQVPCDDSGAKGKFTPNDLAEFITRKGSNVASAGTLVLGDGDYFHVTGSTTITDIDFSPAWNGRRARLVFDGVLQLTHHATTLQLPGSQDLITTPGDSCTVVQDAGDNVKITQYERYGGYETVNPTNAKIDADQAIGASTTALLIGSLINIPDSRLRVGTIFRITGVLTKTAAGTVALQFLFKIGTLGTTSDATRLTFALPVGTAAADEGSFDLEVIVVGPIGASCVIRGSLRFYHRLTTTGLINSGANAAPVAATSAAFDVTGTGLKAHLSLVTGASYSISIKHISVTTDNL